MNKRITTRSIETGIQAAKKHGIRVKTGWIFGLPGTLDEQYKSISLMRRLRPHEISIHQLIPFPGTEYYNHPEAYGIRIRDRKDFKAFCYGGLGTNVSFDYLSIEQYLQLLQDTSAALEADGYVSSDRATRSDEYIYTTPLHTKSLVVFRTIPTETSVVSRVPLAASLRCIGGRDPCCLGCRFGSMTPSLQPRIDGLTFQGQHAKSALKHPPPRLFPHEAFETCFSNRHLSKSASECILTYIESCRGSL